MPKPEKVPNVDFTKIPDEYRGSWVVLRLGEVQEVLSRADTAQAAMKMSHADPNDPMIVLTQVPEVPTAAWMMPSGE